MAITITRDLNVVPIGVPPVIHLSQYDSDFTLVFNLYASTGALTIPSGTTAEIRGTKRDGNGYDADATVSGTTVTVTGDVQMTAIAGANIYELALYKNSKQLFTSNFILAVEPSALDGNTITSESVLKELNAIIAGAATATEAAEDAEDAADRAEEAAQSIIITDRVKEALMNIVNNVAWTGDDPTGQSYINALYSAFYTVALVSISAVFTQGNNPIFDSDSLDDLKQYLVVTAHYDDGSSGTVTDYTLSGSLSSSTSTITVTYSGKTTTFTVSVTMPVFDYKASRDGLLSEQSGITLVETNDQAHFSERMSGAGNLRLEGTNDISSAYLQFKMGDNPTTGKWRLRINAMTYKLSSSSNYVGGLRPNVSNGDEL